MSANGPGSECNAGHVGNPRRAYNAVMRRRFAQIVILATACLLAGRPQVEAQDSGCPTRSASASDDRQSSGPEISIANVTFSGSLQLPVSDQDQIAASIKRQDYGESPDGATDDAVERVRAGWQDHGYFKVKVSGDKRTLTSRPDSRRIALSFYVEEGSQYSLDRITFKNYKLMADVSAVRGLFPIDNGDIFSREKIAKGLENLRKAYGEMGYINFTSVPETQFDDENKLISLEIDIDEGKQFYLSNINVLGLDELARQELLKSLPIKRGQIYNSRLWELSLQKYSSMFPDCQCGDSERRLDEKAGTVALTLDLRPCSD
jgi:outer membrane protein assembly factor BamA